MLPYREPSRRPPYALYGYGHGHPPTHSRVSKRRYYANNDREHVHLPPVERVRSAAELDQRHGPNRSDYASHELHRPHTQQPVEGSRQGSRVRQDLSLLNKELYIIAQQAAGIEAGTPRVTSLVGCIERYPQTWQDNCCSHPADKVLCGKIDKILEQSEYLRTHPDELPIMDTSTGGRTKRILGKAALASGVLAGLYLLSHHYLLPGATAELSEESARAAEEARSLYKEATGGREAEKMQRWSSPRDFLLAAKDLAAGTLKDEKVRDVYNTMAENKFQKNAQELRRLVEPEPRGLLSSLFYGTKSPDTMPTMPEDQAKMHYLVREHSKDITRRAMNPVKRMFLELTEPLDINAAKFHARAQRSGFVDLALSAHKTDGSRLDLKRTKYAPEIEKLRQLNRANLFK